jgi:hypothetical protein
MYKIKTDCKYDSEYWKKISTNEKLVGNVKKKKFTWIRLNSDVQNTYYLL